MCNWIIFGMIAFQEFKKVGLSEGPRPRLPDWDSIGPILFILLIIPFSFTLSRTSLPSIGGADAIRWLLPGKIDVIRVRIGALQRMRLAS